MPTLVGVSTLVLSLLVNAGIISAPGLPQAAFLVEDWDARSITPQTDNTTLVGGFPGTKGVSGAATVGGAPKYRNGANGVGGIPGIQFNGGSDCLNYGQPATIKAAIDSRNYTRINIFRTIGTPGFGCIASYGGSDTGSFDYGDGVNTGRFGAPACGSNIPYAEQTTFGFLSVAPNASFNLNSIPGVESVGANGSTIGRYVPNISGPMGTGVMAFGNVLSGSGVPWTGVLTRSLIWSVVLTPTEVMQAYKLLAPIYGQTLKYSLKSDYKIFDGDSITASIAVTGSVADTFPWKAAQTMGLAVGQWSMLAIGGADIVNTMTVLAPTQINNLFAVIGKPLKICAGEWRNQQAADPISRNNANAYITLVRGVSGSKVCWWTSLSATDDPNANRNAYNASWDANSANVDAYNATHLDTFIGISGAATANPTYFADGVHTTNLGCTQMNTRITPTFSAM